MGSLETEIDRARPRQSPVIEMNALTFSKPLERILCLGAHCDDIEIGCGGAMLRLLAEHPRAAVRWVVFGGTDPARAAEARSAAGAVLGNDGRHRVEILSYSDSYFPASWERIKREFDRIRREFDSGLIFTHCQHDAHQDHRLIQEFTRNSFRDHCILEYEIPKYDGDLWRANTYIPLDPAVVDRKIQLLMDHFASQAHRPWFTPDTFRATLRLRGIECNAPGGWAEGFRAAKIVL